MEEIHVTNLAFGLHAISPARVASGPFFGQFDLSGCNYNQRRLLILRQDSQDS